jgi:hypothetical protein
MSECQASADAADHAECMCKIVWQGVPSSVIDELPMQPYARHPVYTLGVRSLETMLERHQRLLRKSGKLLMMT